MAGYKMGFCVLAIYWWRLGFEVRGRHQATVHSREKDTKKAAGSQATC